MKTICTPPPDALMRLEYATPNWRAQRGFEGQCLSKQRVAGMRCFGRHGLIGCWSVHCTPAVTGKLLR